MRASTRDMSANYASTKNEQPSTSSPGLGQPTICITTASARQQAAQLHAPLQEHYAKGAASTIEQATQLYAQARPARHGEARPAKTTKHQAAGIREAKLHPLTTASPHATKGYHRLAGNHTGNLNTTAPLRNVPCQTLSPRQPLLYCACKTSPSLHLQAQWHSLNATGGLLPRAHLLRTIAGDVAALKAQGGARKHVVVGARGKEHTTIISLVGKRRPLGANRERTPLAVWWAPPFSRRTSA